MGSPEKQNHNYAIDVLRTVSILAVIMIHTTTRSLEITGLNVGYIPWTLFLNQISRFAVPLFFMLSGFVLELSYNSSSSYADYLKKRVNRIFIPYIFWSAIYFFLVYTQHNNSFFSALLTGSASYQLYFIPSLFILYIIFPFIHKSYRIISNKWTLMFLGIAEILFLANDYYLKPLPLYYPVSIALFNLFIFLLGVVASRHGTDLINLVKKWKYALATLTVSLAGYVFWEGGSRYLNTHNYLAFYSQWRPSVLVYTVSLFALLYYFFQRKLPALIVKTLSQLSFFVFFVHVIWLEVIWNAIGKPLSILTNTHIVQQIWYDPAFFILVAFVSFLTAFVVRRIPYISKLTG